MMKRLMIAAAIAAALFGCGKNEAEKPQVARAPQAQEVAPHPSSYANLATNDVVVRVNGADLTKGEIERQIAFRIALAKMRPDSKMDARKEARLVREMRRSCDEQFVLEELMRAYALSNGVTVTEEDRVPMRKQLVKTYTRGGNYRQLVKGLSDDHKAILGEGVDRELWVKKGREKLTADNMQPVADEEVANRRAYFESYNVRAKAALAKTWEDASNVWKKATGGYPFEKLVEQYENGDVEHISSVAEWGEIKASDFIDDPELYRVLQKTPKGCITPPFEGDNGVIVVKMLEILPVGEDRPEPMFVLSKIHFELPEIWEVQSDDELRRDLETIHRKQAFNRGFEALVKAATIEYPCGTNLFPRARAVRRSSKLPSDVRARLPRGAKLPE